MIDLLARLGLSPTDVAGLVPCPEARERVSVGLDCHGREAFLAPGAASAWRRMQSAARSDGVHLWLVSAFRSCDYQTGLWERKLRTGESPAAIRRVLAVPGFSQHHTGRALDLGTPGCVDLTESFAATTAFRWLERRASAFGFGMPYGRGNTLGVTYEPWHWCWGKAKDMSLNYAVEEREDRLEITMSGQWTLGEMRPTLEALRARCEQTALRRVFVDARNVTGALPNADRFEAGKLIAATLSGLKIAVVWDARVINKLAENTAVNRGADFGVFGDPAAAQAWLRGVVPGPQP